MVTKGNRVADIGCDHGFVPIWLVSSQTAPSAIAADVRPGPLSRAKAHILEAGLENQIETRLSDGMACLKPGEVDSVVMSGIGGPLMVRILRDSLETAMSLKELILSPQSELEEVRQFLKESGFHIDYERFLEDEGKFYSVFHVTPMPDQREWTEEDYYYGRDVVPEDREILWSWLRGEYCQARKIKTELEGRQESERIRQRQQEMLQKLERIKKKMNQLGVHSDEVQ